MKKGRGGIVSIHRKCKGEGSKGPATGARGGKGRGRVLKNQRNYQRNPKCRNQRERCGRERRTLTYWGGHYRIRMVKRLL